MALQIEQNVDLQPYNSFNLRATARYFVRISNDSELLELISTPIFKENKRFVLGGGTNVVFLNDFQGLVIKSEEKEIHVVEENDEEVHVQVGAGVVWHNFVIHCINNSWGGIENLALIPGTVGAAPIQNIGAYGVEIKNVVKCVDGILMNNGMHRTLTNAECKFSYRESIFKHELENKFFISSVTLSMTKKGHNINASYDALMSWLAKRNISDPSMHDVAQAVMEIRQSKLPDPAVIGNAGSFFKNPVITEQQLLNLQHTYPSIPFYVFENQTFKVPAAWLIEKCGWKGKRVGNVGVHDNQALVIVNHNNASGKEIFQLSEHILVDVKSKFDLTLLREVNMIE